MNEKRLKSLNECNPNRKVGGKEFEKKFKKICKSKKSYSKFTYIRIGFLLCILVILIIICILIYLNGTSSALAGIKPLI